MSIKQLQRRPEACSVSAIQFFNTPEVRAELEMFANQKLYVTTTEGPVVLGIPTPHGTVVVHEGDWVAKDVNNDLYPIEKSVAEKTYFVDTYVSPLRFHYEETTPVIEHVYSGIFLDTGEGNRMGVALRDDTFEFTARSKTSGTTQWYRFDFSQDPPVVVPLFTTRRQIETTDTLTANASDAGNNVASA